jgi:hypothetical protein
VLPVLCGSLHRHVEAGRDPVTDPLIGNFLDALAEATVGRKVCFIAGADLAHVGPRFGDGQPLAEPDRQRVAEADQLSLDACAEGNAIRFWDSVAADGDARRVCGLAPIYHTLRLVGRCQGETLVYEQCDADEDGGSIVSIGGVALR